MTQVGSPESILGDFSGIRLELDNRGYRLGRDGDDFWVEIEAPSFVRSEAPPPPIRRNIQLVTGSHHRQVYWFSTGNGREVARLPFTWVIDRQRWIPRRMTFVTPPTDGPRAGVVGFETFDVGRWNGHCIRCHSTHGKPRTTVSPTDTSVVEFGISCEACHGPGQAHVDYHHDVAGASADPLVHPRYLDKQRSVEVCGRCHGFWAPKGARGDLDENWDEYDRQGMTYRPGDDFQECGILLDSIDDSWHWPDGMARVLAREYHGVAESQCHQQGELTCLSCHAMHQEHDDPRPLEQWADDQLHVGMRGNLACVQCHEQYNDPDVLTAHTHHPATSQGSVCYNCHMPNTAYSLLKASRSHAITSPTVEETLNVGRPNACNLCHLDKSLRWTGQHLADWYGQAVPDMTADPATEVADSVRLALKGDAAQRALIAWHFSWEPAREASGDKWMAPYLAYLLADDYTVVREVARHSLRQHRGYEDLEYEKFELRTPAEELRRKRGRVLELWKGDKHRPRDANPSLLLLPGGKLDTEKVDELLRLRNNRLVDVSE